MIANYHSIDTFSSVDGPGIRYVIFLQGCNMLCKFCHNVDVALNVKNKQITVDEVVNDFLQYQSFYKNGGITVSGGEPLLQIDFIIELFKKLKQYNVHTAIQTQGTLFSKNIKYYELLKVTDLFIVDLKGVDNEHSLKVCNKKIDKTLEFLKFLDQNNKSFVITYVLLPGINDTDYCFDKLGSILAMFNPVNMSFKLLPYHRLGTNKWQKLGLEYELEHIKEPTSTEIKQAMQAINQHYQYYLALRSNQQVSLEYSN